MSNQPARQLSVFDAVSLIVGIIIGVGIYQVGPDVARGTGGAAGFMLIWLLGGVLSLCGALGYAELASAYPQAGGDYVYLGRAYGRWAGFLFGWMQLVIVRPGDIAVMAFAFATYASAIWDPWAASEGASPALILYAAAATVLLTGLNLLGVRQGARTQNLLTGIKVVGLLLLVAVALAVPGPGRTPEPVSPLPASLALIFVLFSYGGWNEMAYVAAEVKDPRRGILRALLLGTGAVTLLYLLVNGAFLVTLGYEGVAASRAVAADSVASAFPRAGGRLISLLICISALGAVNGLIFTGARITYAVGRDHRLFRPFARWDPAKGTPTNALILQGVMALILICTLGSFIDTLIYTAPAVYLFYLATSLAVIVLRFREPEVERPYRVTLYPLPTLVFCGVCGFLIYSAVTYKPTIALAALGMLLLGLPVYAWSRWTPKSSE